MESDINSIEFILEINSGSEKAFKILFDSFHVKVYTVARKIGVSHDDAEDIVQETFLQLWRQKGKIKENLAINGLIYTIAKRLVFKKIKNEVFSRSAESNDLNQKGVNGTAEIIEYNEMEKTINEAIKRLPESQQAIFQLSYQNGLSITEIAKELNISKRSVENQIFRARKRMKSLLANHITQSILFLLFCYWNEYL